MLPKQDTAVTKLSHTLRMPWRIIGSPMRTLFLIVNGLTLILMAGMLQADAGWCLALLGCIAGVLLYVLGEKERRVEHQQVKQEERRAIFHAAQSVLLLSDQSQPPAEQETD